MIQASCDLQGILRAFAVGDHGNTSSFDIGSGLTDCFHELIQGIDRPRHVDEALVLISAGAFFCR